MIVSRTGSGRCFYFEVSAQRVDASATDAGLSFKFGDSSDVRISDLVRQRMDLLESIPVRLPASTQGGKEVSLSEFLGSVGLSFPVPLEPPRSVIETG
ncbi:hypothetical protein [Neorickettsia sennetsu]|uniref:Uncharacterized protein n=1 Tax=Ehrlichia sennetsu (strain ATCC VR-367 / Miyayama) TaxID=222891 RepID=Q2GCU1_EHRS3|nr:hypothetical protein [Neorickettsia sennetsu]ABD46312.1 hypothetical protein NSE_0837 [Neorickettsia sennetsu str. Miyayama]